MTLPLPEAANADQLTSALRRVGLLDGGRVTSVTVDKSLPTLLSQIFWLRLSYDGNVPAAPPSLILKTELPNRPAAQWESGRKEVAFYTDVASATPPGLLPRCFDARHDTSTGAWHLLLEDLSDSHMVATQWPLPPSLAQCEKIVRTHARFKASWWDDPRLGKTVGTWPQSDGVQTWLQNLVKTYESFADSMGDRLSVERRGFYARLFDQAPRLVQRYLDRRRMTIIQGDSHFWNCFLPREGLDDSSRLFDWDGWRVTFAAEDLAYMMAMHWYPELRQRAEPHLLDCFHQELEAHGVADYDRRALQDDYRLGVLWMTTRPIWIQSFGIPPLIWWNHLERIHLAAEDLDCRELLG